MINVRHSIRTLAKSPFVSGVAILSLALGIGANSAIFSLFNEMLLEPLPVVQPGQLVNLSAPGPIIGTNNSCNLAGDCGAIFSYPMFRDLQKANTGFSGIAAHVLFGANVAYQGVTVNGDGLEISGSYFPVLGLKPALGRLIGPQDDTPIGQNFVTVLSYGFWTSQLGGSSSVIGRNIVVNGKSMEIVGVAARGFEGTTLGAQPKLFVPMSMHAEMESGSKDLEQRDSYWVYLFARLKPGVSMAQAKASINAVYTPILSEVEAPLATGMSDSTLKRFKAKLITVEEGRRGQSSLHAETETPLVLLFCITGIVLLIACANIANLLLARGAGRSMEMAVRLSLGARRGQIIAQLLTESVLLAIIGGIASLFVANWTLSVITSLMPMEMSSDLHVSLSGTTIGFAALLSIATGFVFGLFPAFHSTRTELASAMRDAGGKQTAVKSAARFRTSLVTAQIALSMSLLMAAGLFAKNLKNVSAVDLGLKIDHVTKFAIAPVLNGYEPARSRILFGQVLDELAAIPGVTGVTSARVPILQGNWGSNVNVEGVQRGPDNDSHASYNEISADFFRVMGIPMLSGREFTRADALGRPKVAIVNEAFARKLQLGRDAVGKHMSQGADALDMEIVGLVKDSRYQSAKQKIPPVFYFPYMQDSTLGANRFYVRSGMDPSVVMRAIPGVIKKLDPNLPVADLITLERQVKDNVFLDRMISTLSAAFAALATLLAAIGLYGVLAYSVALRTREIGVRMALGANGGEVQAMVLKQVAVMTAIGAGLGLAGALALGNLAQSLLYEMKGWDPLVMLLSMVAFTAVAFGAGFLPALRASRIDPMQALRQE
jgi:predicted permease